MLFKDEWKVSSQSLEGAKGSVLKYYQDISASRLGKEIAKHYGFTKREEKSGYGEDIYKIEVIVVSPKRYQQFITAIKDLQIDEATVKLIFAYLHEMHQPDQPL